MKKFFVICLLFWHGVVFANEAEFQRGLDAFNASNFKESFDLLKPLAEQGEAVAQVMLGAMYADGKGVSQDYKEALKWFRKSAEQGNAGGQIMLGVMYADGLGVSQDYKEALKWWHLSAEQGDPMAQYNLGIMYVNGDGVSQSPFHAYMWLAIAEFNGHENAGKAIAIVFKSLTPASLQEANKLVVQCINSNYKNCD